MPKPRVSLFIETWANHPTARVRTCLWTMAPMVAPAAEAAGLGEMVLADWLDPAWLTLRAREMSAMVMMGGRCAASQHCLTGARMVT